ncbi:hypothetical protein AB0368_07095 [Actinoplanes sp. NPDC051475]|uniref:hypothetical protein n=1 Tax=Actinoplanes sp. NPDC051475 TaxID=3157225 RepID=UPI00344F2690
MSSRDQGYVEGLYEDLMNEINEALDDLQKEANEFAEKMNDVMRWLPGPVCSGMVFAWKKFLESYNKVFDQTQKFLAQPGSPPALFRIGGYWDSYVGAPVSNVQAEATAFGMKADNAWTGTAARAYGDSAEAQGRALAGIKPMAEAVQDALKDLAWGLIAFWTAVVAAIVTFIAGMIVAAGLLASVLGAPAAPVDAGGTALTCLGLLTAAVAAALGFAEKVNGSLVGLQQQLSDNTGMVREGDQYVWPRLDNSGTWQIAQ